MDTRVTQMFRLQASILLVALAMGSPAKCEILFDHTDLGGVAFGVESGMGQLVILDQPAILSRAFLGIDSTGTTSSPRKIQLKFYEAEVSPFGSSLPYTSGELLADLGVIALTPSTGLFANIELPQIRVPEVFLWELIPADGRRQTYRSGRPSGAGESNLWYIGNSPFTGLVFSGGNYASRFDGTFIPEPSTAALLLTCVVPAMVRRRSE